MNARRSSTVLVLLVLLGVALAAGAYFLLYSPLLEEKAAADKQVEAIEAENEAARQELTKLAAQQKELPELQAQLDAARGEFPTSLELSQFTRYLGLLVEESGATVERIAPEYPVQLAAALPLPAGPADHPAPVVAQPPSSLYQYKFNIEVTGTWPQANDYLGKLQEDKARMFLVTELGATPVQGRVTNTIDGLFLFEIRGYTYALVPPDQVPVKVEE
jgi:hypothetical protein